MTAVELTINSVRVKADIEPRTSLADFLRHHLRLTATHIGCEHGVCGSCTVMIDGAPARSCIAFTAALDGCDVRTIEGFDDDPLMEQLRAAFRIEHGLQCGFCTSGMLITSHDVVKRLGTADEKRIRAELAGNLCRCTGYVGIVRSVMRVMRELPAGARVADSGKPADGPREPYRGFSARTDDLSDERPALPALVENGAGSACITEQFVVTSPRTEVWILLADIPRMVRCMPGAELLAITGREIKGSVSIAFGPISARFIGSATVERDDAAYAGVIRGWGSAEQGGSRAKGQVTYQLVEAQNGSSTRVQLSLVYQLQGPLAQFGRSGLVRDFTRRLIAQFAGNLMAELLDRPAPSPEASRINIATVLWSLLFKQIKRWLGATEKRQDN